MPILRRRILCKTKKKDTFVTEIVTEIACYSQISL